MPCLYRVHPDPMPDKMHAFGVFAHNMNLNAAGIGEGTTTRRLTEILAEAEEKGIAEVVSGVMLRSLAKAKYSEKPAGHYGLALPLYAHFTSPIRRYPDLFVHRAITAALTGARRPVHPGESARASSDAEVRAVTAERQIEDLYMAQYASFHIGEEYEAVVTSVCSFGVFARTDKLFEGLIPAEALFGTARTEFDEGSLTLRGRIDGGFCTVRIGDRIRVRVENADVPAGKIDLVPAKAASAPQERTEPGGRHSFHARPSGARRPRTGTRPTGTRTGDKPHGSRPGKGGTAKPKSEKSARPAVKNGKKPAGRPGRGKSAPKKGRR